MNTQEVERLINAADNSRSINRFRDSALIRLALYNGLRNSEIRQLNWQDINFEAKTITIRNGKGRKDRVVPINSDLEKHLWDYLQSRLPLVESSMIATTLKILLGNFQIH